MLNFKDPDISLITRLFFIETLTTDQIYLRLLCEKSYTSTNLQDVDFSLSFIKNVVLEAQDYLFQDLFDTKTIKNI